MYISATRYFSVLCNFLVRLPVRCWLEREWASPLVEEFYLRICPNDVASLVKRKGAPKNSQLV
jgi:hypothetical protein